MLALFKAIGGMLLANRLTGIYRNEGFLWLAFWAACFVVGVLIVQWVF